MTCTNARNLFVHPSCKGSAQTTAGALKGKAFVHVHTNSHSSVRAPFVQVPPVGPKRGRAVQISGRSAIGKTALTKKVPVQNPNPN